MTIPADVAIVTPASDGEQHSYVDWPAIIAGVVLASAISIVLLTFGSAIGLSFTSFEAREGVSPIWIGVAAATWLLWVQVSSFMAGGYLTGRLRRRVGDATEHEVHVRDGAHGLLVWGGALVIGAILAVSGLGSAANAIGSAASTVTGAAANVAGSAAEGAADSIDPNAYFVDTLFRDAPEALATDAAPAADAAAPATTETPAVTTDPATPTTSPVAAPATPVVTTTPAAQPTAMTTSPADMDAVRGEATRILAYGAVEGEVAEEDRTYLAQLVARNTDLSQEEAAARVDEVMANVEAAREQAVEAAETARRTGILGAFLIAAAFLASAAGAYWAAMKGGQHRDEGTDFTDMFRRF